jgi:hypothetical protein
MLTKVLNCTTPLFSFLFGQPSFLGLARPIENVLICLSLEEIAVHAGHKVLMEVDKNISLIARNPKGI